MYYVSDKVKNKFDDGDYFKGNEYVDKIVDAITNDDIKSIGVYGKWGVGKTSIIKNTLSKLVEKEIYKENEIIEYNAWKYNQYDFMRDFLIVCSTKLEGTSKAKEREESYYSDSSEDRQLYLMLWKKLWEFIKKSWRVFIALLIVYILAFVIILYVNYLSPNLYDCGDLLIPLTITLISFILPLFLVSEITHKNTSRKFSPEQFARDFEEIVKDKNVLIFIDDIDRCNYNEIITTFDTLKTFILDENYNVKFIIPVDPNILLNSLDGKTYDYLSKIIDFPIEIKNYTKIEFQSLKNEIMEKVNSDYKNIIEDGLYFAAKYYSDTPRKFKKFANEFINEIYNFNPDNVADKGYMFAKLIILKNEYSTFYLKLIKNYKLVNEITKDALILYNTPNNQEDIYEYRGINFSDDLLDFLNKTASVDLYDFAMFENRISFAEYKIRALCENPIDRNSLDLKSINLEKNKNLIDYEINENIVKPLKSNRFFYNDKIKRICFLIRQFRNQDGFEDNKSGFEEIMENLDYLKSDNMLFENISTTTEKKLNIKYISQCLEEYSPNISADVNSKNKIVEWMLDIVNSEAKDNFEVLENDLIDFIQKFKNDTNICNESILDILQLFLTSDFGKYHEVFSWFLAGSSTAKTECFLEKIIECLNNNITLNQEIVCNYLSDRYKKINCINYFKSFVNHYSEIKTDFSKFNIIIKPLIENFNGKGFSFEYLYKFINETDIISADEEMNCLILQILKEMKNSKDFNNSSYEKLLVKTGNIYNDKDKRNNKFEELILTLSKDNMFSILGIDDNNSSIKNFKLMKLYEVKFNELNKKEISLIMESYCNNEGYVILDDLKRHGILYKNYKNELFELVQTDINKRIYLLDEADDDEIIKIDLSNLKINEIELSNIENKNLKSIISGQIKNKLNDCVKIIKNNQEDKELVKSSISEFLENAKGLYCDLSYSDKTLWTKLKVLDKYVSHLEMKNDFYIPELKKYPDIVKLFFEGTYKDNYMKNNIDAETIIKGLK